MKHQQHGVTIVEGLVALVILSVGMLGIASLYVASLKTGRTALTRTNAVNLANDMLDRIRANGTAGTAYRFAGGSTPPDAADCGEDGVCTRDELAQNDLREWVTAVTASLPLATAVVAVTPMAPADIYQVTVNWQEAGEATPFSYRASLEMLPVRP
jgi:type IV pilus assembly protein PilV